MSSSVEQGPSEGLLAKAKEALRNPHLVWVGEKAPSPRQAAIICQTLGLTNEEEKQAKAIAVLKRDYPDWFENHISGVSSIKGSHQGGRTMKVKWGMDHYGLKLKDQKRKLLKRVENVLKKVVPRNSPMLVKSDMRWGDGKVSVHPEKGSFPAITIRVILPSANDPQATYQYLKYTRGWTDLEIHVRDRAYADLAKSFARRYERISKASVTVFKQY